MQRLFITVLLCLICAGVSEACERDLGGAHDRARLQHTVPDPCAPPQVITPGGVSRIWVDQDGTFYPENWIEICGRPPGSGFFSLMRRAASGRHDARCNVAYLEQFRNSLLRQIEHGFNDTGEVTVLVHGFNNNEQSITRDYRFRIETIDAIRERHADSANHSYILFYWNSLNSRSWTLPFTALRNWMVAAGNAEMAGARGLRPVLEALDRAEVGTINLMSHSLGGAVIMSAFGGYKYPDDRIVLEDLVEAAEYRSAAQMTRSDIRIFMTAPAINRWHFSATGHEINAGLRRLPPTVRRIVSTTNSEDFAIAKIMGGRLAASLNSTEFGYSTQYAENVYNALRDLWPDQDNIPYTEVIETNFCRDFTEGDLPACDSHDASVYVRHPEVGRALAEFYAIRSQDAHH